jgi:hypothetical protein
MDALTNLHQQLRAAASLLDGAATQIRDLPLSPTRQHVHSIGEALCSIYEIQSAIYKLRPELEIKYEEPPEEERAANRRLGEALIAAYDLADSGQVSAAAQFLAGFALNEPSELHRSLAKSEQEKIVRKYDNLTR